MTNVARCIESRANYLCFFSGIITFVQTRFTFAVEVDVWYLMCSTVVCRLVENKVSIAAQFATLALIFVF